MNSISLYRCLLKNAKKIEQYNFRSFAIRKVYVFDIDDHNVLIVILI